MQQKVYRITLKLNFEIDATSKIAAREIAREQATEWLKEVEGVKDEEIIIQEKK